MKQKGGVFEKGGREGDKSGRKARVWVGSKSILSRFLTPTKPHKYYIFSTSS
jgi:hypothetical protein